MKKKSFQEAVGFSVKDTLALYWLHETQYEERYAHDVFQRFTETFPGRKVGYEYVARVANHMEAENLLVRRTEKRRVFYTITDLGRARLERYQALYFERFHEIIQVLDRFYYTLTKNGQKPPAPKQPLREEFRAYFSKLISVKDIVRYMTFELARTRSSFNMAEVGHQLEARFGWCPSNGYLYQVAWELEEENYLIGEWPDEKRTRRLLKGTDSGIEFAEVITMNLTEQITTNLHFLRYMLAFLQKTQKNS